MPVPLNTTPKNPFSFVDTWLIAPRSNASGICRTNFATGRVTGKHPNLFVRPSFHIDMRARVWPLWRFHRAR